MSGAAYVQSSASVYTVGATTASLVGVVTGNTLLVAIHSLSTGVTYTVSDTVNTYVSAVGPTSTGGNQTAQWFSAKNVTGGSLTVTVTPSPSTNTYVVFIEVSGVDHTTPIQLTDSATGSSTAILGNSILTSQPNTYALQLTTSFGAGIPPNTQTANSPWGPTTAGRQNSGSFTVGGSNASAAVADQTVVTSGSSVQASATDTRPTGFIALTLLMNNAATVVYGQQVGAFAVGI